MAVLLVVRGPETGRRIELEQDRAVIGRHPECDIVLDVAAVSRQHAVLSRREGKFYLEDLGSRNGTYVNGRRLSEVTPLAGGDRVVICDVTFDFVDSTGQTGGMGGAGESSLSVMLHDEPVENATTNVMSKLDVSTDYAALYLSAKPEVKLSAVLEISKDLRRAVSLDDILPKLLDSLFKIFLQADRAFVIMREAGTGKLIPRAIRARREDDQSVVRISRTIVNQAMDQKEAILSADASSDSRFDMAQSIADFHIRSMMCAPIIDGEGEALGVLQVDTLNQRSRFTQQDLEVLAGVASQASIAIDKARMHERILAQRALERDLELAHRVQQGLVPDEPPDVPGYQFFHFYEPANLVGGDYYDYVPLPDGRCAVVVGDVAGKGVSAALLMAKLSGEVKFYLASEKDPAQAVRRINTAFGRRDWQDRFVTFVVVMIEPHENTVTIVNAGHMPPLLRHSGGVVEALGQEESGLPLGVVDDFPFESTSRKLEPGDAVVLFTDGISEAMNAARDLYGVERISAQIANKPNGIQSLGMQLLDDVRRFVGTQPQSDDMCLACFERDGA
jgi:serine phosphatase RsbU (regulator of sigma subunit)/pSer/pThr/pTyr-binding forkhead associated (FHA) protein